MLEKCVFANNQPEMALLKCLLLAIGYVGSLYINKSPFGRDHPQTIKQRMKSVAVVCILAPIYLFWNCLLDEDGYTIPIWLGIHTKNIFNATLFPLLLTVMLFTGPIILSLLQEDFGEFKRSVENALRTHDLQCYRTYLVAPFTEEFVFRSCMLPILIPNFGINKSILIAPLFFGVAHVHHIIEQRKLGYGLSTVLISALFQMFYTTLFGIYSAFLFVRTGHLVAPIICHSFCNMMGFPNFESIPDCKYPKLIWLTFFLGLVLFFYLLFPCTEPSLYGSIYV